MSRLSLSAKNGYSPPSAKDLHLDVADDDDGDDDEWEDEREGDHPPLEIGISPELQVTRWRWWQCWISSLCVTAVIAL